MLYLYLSVLLALAGGIHSASLGSDFYFEVMLQLESLLLPFGSSAVINCNTNDPSASVRLEMVPPRQSGSVSSEKISRNGSVFTIHNIIVHDAGKYQCIAERNGQVIRRQILLLINTKKPQMTIVPFKSRRVLVGSSVFYTCEATMGDIEWFKDDGSVLLQLPSAKLLNVNIKSSYDSNNIKRKDLVFKKVDHSHSGNYRCRLTSEERTFEKIVQLSVLGPEAAKITEYSDLEIRVNSNKAELELKCKVTGFPPPHITWTKDGKVIDDCSGQQDCRYIVQHDGLQIKQPRYPDDDADFSCEARNEFGSDKRDFLLMLPASPVLDKTARYLRSQGLFKVLCVLLEGNYPKPHFIWYFKYCPRWQKCPGVWTNTEKRSDVFKASENFSSSVSTLSMLTSRLPTTGFFKFKCEAINDVGSDTKEFPFLQSRP